MNRTKTWLTCMLTVVLQISFAGAAQVLKAVPEKVKFGTFNTFQIKEAIVTLRNTGRETFLVDKIKTDCSCKSATLSTAVPPKNSPDLSTQLFRSTGSFLGAGSVPSDQLFSLLVKEQHNSHSGRTRHLYSYNRRV